MRTDGSVIIDTKIVEGGLEKGLDLLKNQMSSVGVAVEKLGDKIKFSFSDKATVPIENAIIKVRELEQKLFEVTDELSYARKDGNVSAAEGAYKRQKVVYDQLEKARRRLTQVIVQEASKEAKAEERAAQKALKEKERAYKRATKSARAFGKRLTSIVSGAFIFNVISQGLREVTKYFGSALKSNEEFSNSWAKLKGAALTAIQPLYEKLLPVLTDAVKLATNLANLLGQTFASIAGKSSDQMRENAKALNEQIKATEKAGDATETAKKQMAGFDEINVLQNKTDSSDASGSSSAPDFNFEESAATEQLDKLSKFAELAGMVLGLFGKLKPASAILGITGILDIVNGIKNIAQNGINWDNATQVITGCADIGTMIGFLFGNMKLAGISMTISGLSTIVSEIAQNWEAIKQGDWSGVDKVTLVIGAIQTLGGVLTALDTFSKLAKKVKTAEAAEGVEDVSTNTSKLTGSLKNLMKNLAFGIVIIAEIAVAAGLIVGAIWGLGALLEQVGNAWQPVFDNGTTVAAAVGIGVGLLAAIGAATAGLGTLGTSLIVPLALGIAILAEIGASTVLFLAEILVVGLMLNQIGIAWQPVLDNGEAIATAIGVGTGLLIGIGAVAAALGVATVATAGALPLAIGLGTALLVELALAFVVFCDSLIDVANKLVDLSIPMDGLNAILPGLKADMDDFTSFMGSFALAVVAFTVDSAIAGIAATVDKVISFFTTDPAQRMHEEIDGQTKEFSNLIYALEKINPLIKKATKLVGEYKENMGSFESATGGSGGFLNSVIYGAKGAINGLITFFEGMANGVIKCINTIINALNKISFDIPSWVPLIGGQKFGFNIKQVAQVSIPRLAQGAVIPPNREFMAVLGDQKHGTNIEAPLDTIKQALAEVLAMQGSGGETNVNVTFTGDLAQLARVLKPAIETETRRKGGSLAKGAAF